MYSQIIRFMATGKLNETFNEIFLTKFPVCSLPHLDQTSCSGVLFSGPRPFGNLCLHYTAVRQYTFPVTGWQYLYFMAEHTVAGLTFKASSSSRRVLCGAAADQLLAAARWRIFPALSAAGRMAARLTASWLASYEHPSHT